MEGSDMLHWAKAHTYKLWSQTNLALNFSTFIRQVIDLSLSFPISKMRKIILPTYK